MFWSGKKLAGQIQNIFSPWNAKHIDCNAYTLHVGDEIYISVDGTPREGNVARRLERNEQFIIPPGQFGFILTNEILTIPINCMALINVKSSIKLSGLVNVSGFHVDPGYHGKLVISVFNAGPKPVVLSEGEPCFLIWITDLSGETDKYYSKNFKTGYMSITPKLVQSIPSSNISVHTLEKEMKELRGKVDLVLAIVLGVGIPFFVALLVAVLQLVFGKWMDESSSEIGVNLSAFLIYVAVAVPSIVIFSILYWLIKRGVSYNITKK